MIPFLAQITDVTPPGGFSQFIANAFYTVGLLTAVIVAWRHLQKPAPTEHTIADQPVRIVNDPIYATKEDISEMSGEMDRRFDAMSKAGSTSREKMHEATRDLEQRVAGLEAKVETQFNSQNQQLYHIETKLDRLIERKP